jgi:MFS family permease
MYYSVAILQQAGVGTVTTAIWLAVPVAAAQLVGCLIGGALIDRVGRRPLVLLSLFGAAAALGVEGAGFAIDQYMCSSAGGDGPSVPLPPVCRATTLLSILGMVVYLLAFGLGMSPIPWALNAEIYPMHVRSQCVAIGTGCNWVANFAVAATFLSLQDAVTPAGAFWLYGGIALAGGVWLAAVLPETAGRSLEQIQRLFDPSTSSSPTSRMRVVT